MIIMKKIYLILIFVLASFFAFSSQETKNVAKVKVKRGLASALAPDGTKTEIKKGMWIKEGSIIKTGDKSFVRLSFIDKSSMNIGPKSELKIEQFSKDKPGVINVLTGKIRSKVTKDYLQLEKDKSKLFIKSKSAVMGIRGTEFLFSANALTGASTAVLFEGSVVFSKINKGDNLANLEALVNKGRKISPGQFSVAIKNKKKATVPSKMSTKQFKGLEGNSEFVASSKKNVKKIKSIVPPGLAGDIVSSDSNQIVNDIQKVTAIKLTPSEREVDQDLIKESKGYVKGDDIKPVDGSIVHIDSGAIIPLGVDSTFDKNTGEWVSNSVGAVDTNGGYIPPEGFAITDDGKLLTTDLSSGQVKEVVIHDIKPLDEVRPLEEIQVIDYTPPANEPIPGDLPPLAPGEEPINPDGEKLPEGELNPDGEFGPEVSESGDEILPPPPKPGDCSTCNQPNTFGDSGAPPPIPTGKTRAIIQVNRQ